MLLLFSHQGLSDCLQFHGLQHTRLPCPSLSLRVCSDLCPLSQCCCPLLFLPSIFPSIRVSSNESALHIRWPKYCSISISPSSEYLGLISFGIDQFDFLADQGTLGILLQHHNSKAPILWHSAFFMVLHPYTSAGKIIALTIQTFVGKVVSVLFNMLSRFVIAFLPRSRCL